MTTSDDRDRFAFLTAMGVDAVRHNSHEDLLPHLVGTRDLLRLWGARPALCDAGLCHSLYGTEYFSTETVPIERRDDVRAVIGDEAEALVFLWCFGRRLSLPKQLTPDARLRIQDRRTGDWIAIDAQQFEDLVNLWIADTLEQLPRVPEREVATARSLLVYRSTALPAAFDALEDIIERYSRAS